MHVLVPVQMRGRNPGLANLADLRVPLPLHFIQWQAAAGDTQQQAFRPAIQFACRIQKTRYPIGRSGRRAIAQVQVHANSQLRILPPRVNPRIERPPVGQQRCAGHQALAVDLHDPPVHPFRPSQVIRIDDQIPHFCLSLALLAPSFAASREGSLKGPVPGVKTPVLSDSYS